MRLMNKGEGRRRNLFTKHYRGNLIWMKLGILRVEVAEDEVDVVEEMLKIAQIKLGSRIGMA